MKILLSGNTMIGVFRGNEDKEFDESEIIFVGTADEFSSFVSTAKADVFVRLRHPAFGEILRTRGKILDGELKLYL